MLVANRFDDICDKISIVKSTRKREREITLLSFLYEMKYKSIAIFPKTLEKVSDKKLSILCHREVQALSVFSMASSLGVARNHVEDYTRRGRGGGPRVAFSWKFLPFREELADNYRARGQPPSIRRCDCASSRRWNFARKRRRDRRRETHCSKKEKRGESNLHRFPVNPFLSRRGELSLLRRRDSSTLQRILQRIFVTRVYCNRCISLLHI